MAFHGSRVPSMTSSCVRLDSSFERLIEALLAEHQVLTRMLAQPRLRAPAIALSGSSALRVSADKKVGVTAHPRKPIVNAVG